MKDQIPTNLFPTIQETLFSGGYNLLFGSGISLDSVNQLDEKFRSGETLRIDICNLLSLPSNTPLHRAIKGLDSTSFEKEIIKKFLCKKPGDSLATFPKFLWRRIFSFNIDNVIECLFEKNLDRKQDIESINFIDNYKSPSADRTSLQLIHLHGSVLRPNDNFVFSLSDYAKIGSSNNPWLHVLSELIATEPFIISGTSLNEPDLEYFLSFRSNSTPRLNRGPSFLIDPNPDLLTKKECERLGVILLKGTFGEFLLWLNSDLPSPPSIYEILVPPIPEIISEKCGVSQKIRFFSDFKLVSYNDLPLPKSGPSQFMFGREPEWEDIHCHFDIERQINQVVIDSVNEILNKENHVLKVYQLILLYADAGFGKTTILMRIGHDLTKKGVPVFYLNSMEKIDVDSVLEIERNLSRNAVFLIDGIADYIGQIDQIISKLNSREKIKFIGCERVYRQEYIEENLSQDNKCIVIYGEKNYFNKTENSQLIERYRKFGLIGNEDAVRNIQKFLNYIKDEPIAVTICKILNDSRPLEKIIESLWDDSDQKIRINFLLVALAQHCFKGGIRNSILQSILGREKSISQLMIERSPLSLSYNYRDNEFVVTKNNFLGEEILKKVAEKDPEQIKNSFISLGERLWPFVNRFTIMARTAEARLVGRLFDVDKVVVPLLGFSRGLEFFNSIQEKWEWNSRYWEQKALLMGKKDLKLALQYARQAVSIEKHPFTLNTLGKLLFDSVYRNKNGLDESFFNEAIEVLLEAIKLEKYRSRITVYPYITLFQGVSNYIESGGQIEQKQIDAILTAKNHSKLKFSGQNFNSIVQRLEEKFQDLIRN